MLWKWTLSKSIKPTPQVSLPNQKTKGMIAKLAVSPMKTESELIKIMVRAAPPLNPKHLLWCKNHFI